MRLVSLVAGLFLIATVLWDAFETIVLPRTVARRFRLALLYVRGTWRPWARVARTFQSENRRERFLAVYGPVSLLGLLVVWATGLVFGFAMLLWSAGSKLLAMPLPAWWHVRPAKDNWQTSPRRDVEPHL